MSFFFDHISLTPGWILVLLALWFDIGPKFYMSSELSCLLTGLVQSFKLIYPDLGDNNAWGKRYSRHRSDWEKVKVSYSLIAVGAVGVNGAILGTADERRTHSSPFAALAFPNSKKVPIQSWFDREGFPVITWGSPAWNSQPYGAFLHHNWATLTSEPQRLSDWETRSLQIFSVVNLPRVL